MAFGRDVLPADERDAREKVHKEWAELYRHAQQLDDLLAQAATQWPEDKALRVLQRDLRDMLEDLGGETPED
jgi:hypothetical protein